jgi:hypothetical protein
MGRALLQAAHLLSGSRRREQVWVDFTNQGYRMTPEDVAEYLGKWGLSHTSSGLPARVADLWRAAEDRGHDMGARGWTNVNKVVRALRITSPSTKPKALPLRGEYVDALWRHLRPLEEEPGRDARFFMGLVSLAKMFMLRITAAVGRNLRARDLTITTARGGRREVTLARVLGKTSKMDAAPMYTTVADTSPDGRTSRLLEELQLEAARCRGAEGALLVRGTGDRWARPGDDWTPTAVTAVLRRRLREAGVARAAEFTTKSFKGRLTEARARGVRTEVIRRTGAWRKGSRAMDNYIAAGGLGTAVE